jgi:hypothetical protein
MTSIADHGAGHRGGRDRSGRRAGQAPRHWYLCGICGLVRARFPAPDARSARASHSAGCRACLEQLERLGLVFVQRIALRIAAEAHDRAQMFQRQQVLAPLAVDGLQQNLLFDRAWSRARTASAFSAINSSEASLERSRMSSIDAFFVGPFGDRHVDAQAFDAAGVQPSVSHWSA